MTSIDIVHSVIFGLEGPSGTTANAGNIKMLIDLLMRDLVHQVLYIGIKVTRLLVTVGIKQQLGLSKQGIHNSCEKMADTGTRSISNVIDFHCQGQHGLIDHLVKFNLSGKRETLPWPSITEILEDFLQVCLSIWYQVWYHATFSRPHRIQSEL